MATNPKLKRPEKGNGNAALQLEMPAPQVRVRIPEIKMPDINIPDVNMDTTALAEVIAQLGQAMAALAQQQAAILQTIQDHHAVLNKAMANQPDIKVAAPQIKMPPRPTSFTVEMEDDDGEPIYMNVTANSPN